MKLRNTAVLTAALSASLLAGAGVAVAQDVETGPETQVCADATAAVTTATTERDAAKVPSDLEQKAKAAQDAVADGVKLQADLQVKIVENQKLLDVAVSPQWFKDEDVRLKAELEKAKTAQTGLVAARDAAAKNLSDAQASLATEEQELAKAEEARDTACAEPTDPGTENPGGENPGNENPGPVNPTDLNPCDLADPAGPAFIAELEKLNVADAQAMVNKLGENGISLIDTDTSTPTVDVDDNMQGFIVTAVDRYVADECVTDNGSDNGTDNGGSDDDGLNPGPIVPNDDDFSQVGSDELPVAINTGLAA